MAEERQLIGATQPSNIAWFTLAELVARKEKEKALNLARLLCHSLPDRAYTYHLEGDLLWYLGEPQAASTKYLAAGAAYEQEKRWMLAFAATQTAHGLGASGADVLKALVIRAAQADLQAACLTHLVALHDMLEKNSIELSYAQNCVGQLLELRGGKKSANWLGALVQEVCKQPALAEWVKARV